MLNSANDLGKPDILVVAESFLPGFKAGGPIRTLANLVEYGKNFFNFHIVTRDRDWLDKTPYPGIKADEWQKVYGCRVIYLSPSKSSFRFLQKLIHSTPHKLMYLNSFFSVWSIKVIILKRLGLLPSTPIILAPRGEFSPGALRTKKLKYLKKKIFISISRLLKLYKKVIWQATSELEQEHILKYFRARIFIAPNLRSQTPIIPLTTSQPLVKLPGEANFVFISRIAVKKNLDYALESLQNCAGKITFNIYGPIEDLPLWARCKRLISQMPSNITVRYWGEIDHSKTTQVLSNNHFFLFPTRGENFGHVIVESLAAGCPVILSDQTPWRNLEKYGVGWDISLADKKRFHYILQRCVDMNSDEYAEMRRRTIEYAEKFLNNDAIFQHYLRMFNAVLSE